MIRFKPPIAWTRRLLVALCGCVALSGTASDDPWEFLA